MGNYRFRLSDMIPNAWFYKLKDMGSSRGSRSSSRRSYHLRTASPTTPKPLPTPSPTFLPSRASYYYSPRLEAKKLLTSPLNSKSSDTHFPLDPPRKSKRRSRRRATKPCSSPSTRLLTSSVSAGCNCRVLKSEPVAEIPPFHRDVYIDCDHNDSYEFDGICSSWSPSPTCKVISSATDIIIDVASDVSELDLPPILTKPVKNSKVVTEKELKNQPKRSPPGLHRLRMRTNSPRVVAKKPTAAAKAKAAKQANGLSESFAVVKASANPQKDFRESMVEMIVENNIRSSKDLEDLLACYLSLNANEYHDVIVKVFEQIWFDLANIRL
ncbi:transcription repressor OFP1-like [Typha latifolia]|uniref:transcription repressor OFP1-like n=1 Tax=Typha latifolia TaxID=4733 RepID=UPI003C2B36FD